MDVFDREYLDWLDQKTKNGKSVFFDDDFSSSDLAKGIRELFNEVDLYARTFYCLNVGEFENEYNIRDGNNLYRISKLYGPTIAYSLKRYESDEEYLDLENIKHGILSGDENIAVYTLMEEINRDLDKLRELGASMETINSIMMKKIRLLAISERSSKNSSARALNLTQKNYSNE